MRRNTRARARIGYRDGLTITSTSATRVSEDHRRGGKARLRAESRKWLLAKALPKIYGDKVELSGNLNHTHEDRLRELEEMERAAAGRPATRGALVTRAIEAEIEAREKALAAKLKADLEAYARTALKIRSKDSVQRPLIFNKAQQYIHARLEAQRARPARCGRSFSRGGNRAARPMSPPASITASRIRAAAACSSSRMRMQATAKPVRHGAALPRQRAAPH